MRERTRVRDVVNGDHVEVVVVEAAADERASDPAEAVDADSDGHDRSP